VGQAEVLVEVRRFKVLLALETLQAHLQVKEIMVVLVLVPPAIRVVVAVEHQR
jgi:hypothetical protein